MNPRHHARTGSKGTKVLPPHARPAKPPVWKRGTSYNNSNPHHSHHHHSHSTGGAKAASKKVEEPEEDEESGMSSFLQYCATCERQIVTPGSTILYCSEACRKKDISHPPSSNPPSTTTPTTTTTTTSPFTTDPTHSPSSIFFDLLPSGDIMPQLSPTVLRPLSISSSSSSSHLDLLTWRRHESDDPALRYLENFSSDLASRSGRSGGRGRYSSTENGSGSGSGSGSSSGLPSLVHSPSSSYGTMDFTPSRRQSSSSSSSTAASSSTTTRHHTSDLLLIPPSSPHSSANRPTAFLKDASSLKSSASTLTSFRTVEAGGIVGGETTVYEEWSRGAGFRGWWVWG